LALFIGLTPALAEEPQDTFLPLCGEDDPLASDLLQRSRDALQEGRDDLAAELLDQLCGVAAHPVLGNRLVELEEGVWYQGLRAHARTRIAELPQEARRALTKLQDEGARLAQERGDRPSDAEVWLRFPASGHGFAAGSRRLGAAVEAGDLPAARSYLRELNRLHPVETAQAELLAQVTWLEALRAQTAPSRPRDGPPPGANLTVRARTPLGGDPVPAAAYSPSFPLRIGGRTWVSTGAQLLAFDDDGKQVSRIPHLDQIASAPPDVSTRFTAQLQSGSGVAFAPLVLERWVARARQSSSRDGRQDAAFSGRYYSLLGFDPLQSKILWWDGDPGPGADLDASGQPAGVPPGWETADPALLEVLLRGHVLASITDANRVYVALSLKSDEPDLRVFAFERGVSDRQPLVLRPAWPRTSYLLSAERPGGGGEEEAVYPEVAAALALDDAGRLLCTTSVGVTSCLETETGTVLWARRAPPPPGRALGFHRRQGNQASELDLRPPPWPALTLPTPDGTVQAVFFAGSQLLSVDVADGAKRWSQHNQGTSRLLVKDELLLSYGGHRIVAFEKTTGRFKRVQPLNTERCSGVALNVGDALLFPIQAARPGQPPFGNSSIRQLRLIASSNGGVVFQLGARCNLVNEQGAINLLAVPGGVVAASRSQLHVLRWDTR
jgi:hypothetical protein